MHDKVNEILEYRQYVAALISALTHVRYTTDGKVFPAWKCKDLAKVLGITAPTLSKCKTGAVSMNPIAFKKLQNLL